MSENPTRCRILVIDRDGQHSLRIDRRHGGRQLGFDLIIPADVAKAITDGLTILERELAENG